jgi:hypothetical protein
MRPYEGPNLTSAAASSAGLKPFFVDACNRVKLFSMSISSLYTWKMAIYRTLPQHKFARRRHDSLPSFSQIVFEHCLRDRSTCSKSQSTDSAVEVLNEEHLWMEIGPARNRVELECLTVRRSLDNRRSCLLRSRLQRFGGCTAGT